MVPTGPQSSPLAIASMILGIISIPTCCCGLLSTPIAIAGLVLGIVALRKIRTEPQQWSGSGMAIAGIATSSFGILLDVLALVTTFADAFKSRYMGHF
jgi:hypothetical protein